MTVALSGAHTGASTQAIRGLMGEALAGEQTGTGLKNCHVATWRRVPVEEDRGSIPETPGLGRTARLFSKPHSALLMQWKAERRGEGG